jgi:ribosomal-protein-alanine N-acetyltransferase
MRQPPCRSSGELAGARHQAAPATPPVHRLCPMEVESLQAVLDIEAASYPFPWTRGNFVDSLLANHVAWCLLDEHHALLGYAIAMAGVEELHLLNITIAAAHRRRGHARFLMLSLMEHGRRTGARALWLEVRPSNAAAYSLYADMGFERVGLRRQYYPAEGSRREDAWVMRLDLAGPGCGGNG